MTYYSVIGGWITKYFCTYLVSDGSILSQDSYFTSFITSKVSPIVFIFAVSGFNCLGCIPWCGKGNRKIFTFHYAWTDPADPWHCNFSLTLSYTDANGTVRTGLQGLKVYLYPDFSSLTVKRFLGVLLDAMSQLFFSLSVSMGIMVTYGSYVKDDVDLNKSINQIEIFDTGVAFLAGMMIIPAVFVFLGTEGMASGRALIFISSPKVFASMGAIGRIIAIAFFLMMGFFRPDFLCIGYGNSGRKLHGNFP